jgi:diadenosine tetraphosphate (Ap4A) HIT family hydrolase
MPVATLAKFGHPAMPIGETEHWNVLLPPQQVTLGAPVPVRRGPATRFGDIIPAAIAGLHDAIRRIGTILREFVQYERINYPMLIMADPDVHSYVIPRFASERVHLGRRFPDAGWPGPPALGQAAETEAAVRDDMLLRLHATWGAAGA